jgi:sugar transferase EpsL
MQDYMNRFLAGIDQSKKLDRSSGWQFGAKRVLDRAAAVLGILVFSPVLAIVALLIRLNLGSPVLFRQMRPGFRGRQFTLVKFRTMFNDRDGNGELLPDEQRLTRLGKFLRATSIDELPQLWNVLRGDLSLVGPRPLLMSYLQRYSPAQARRHDVMPGITGWAQVNGRNALSWEEKFELDLWYVDHWSFRLDCQILLLTLMRVMGRNGISHVGHSTMPEFTGTTKSTADE